MILMLIGALLAEVIINIIKIYIDIYRALLDKALLICLYPYVPFRLDEIKVSNAVSYLLFNAWKTIFNHVI